MTETREQRMEEAINRALRFIDQLPEKGSAARRVEGILRAGLLEELQLVEADPALGDGPFPDGRPPLTVVDALWTGWETAMDRRPQDRRRPQKDERRILCDALRVAKAGEIAICFAKCAASDYHMKRGKYADRRGGRYNSIGKILKPRHARGETQRSRIDWWLEMEPEERPTDREQSPYDRAARKKAARRRDRSPA